MKKRQPIDLDDLDLRIERALERVLARRDAAALAAPPPKRRGPKQRIVVPTDEAALAAWADEILRSAPGIRITKPNG